MSRLSFWPCTELTNTNAAANSANRHLLLFDMAIILLVGICLFAIAVVVVIGAVVDSEAVQDEAYIMLSTPSQDLVTALHLRAFRHAQADYEQGRIGQRVERNRI